MRAKLLANSNTLRVTQDLCSYFTYSHIGSGYIFEFLTHLTQDLTHYNIALTLRNASIKIGAP